MLKLTDCAVLRLCVCPTVCLFAVFVSQKWAWLTICDVHKYVFVFAAAITSLPLHTMQLCCAKRVLYLLLSVVSVCLCPRKTNEKQITEIDVT